MSVQVEATNRTEAEAQKDLAEATEKDRVRKFLTLAMTRWKSASEYENTTRKDALEDFRFSTGDQWPSDIMSDRQADGRPCLTMDHLNQSIKQVTNELREQRPSIQIDPAGDGASRKVADIYQGICRHVEVISDAEVHYDIVGDHMVRGGVGFLRIYADYLPGDTFDQEIYVESIRNPFLVYSDPYGIKPDHSDHRFKFVISDLARAEFEKDYSGTIAASLTMFESTGDTGHQWISKETVRIADYYYLDEEKHKIYRLPSGEIVPEDQLQPGEKETVDPEDVREVTVTVVKCAKITASDILEERTLPGTIIPIVPALGDDLDINGKTYRAGLVRNAKEPQRMYNYQCSAATEMVALAPRAPYLGPKGMFKSSEAQWKSLNRRNFPYIEFDLVGQTGMKPERNVAEPPIQATVLLIKQAADDLKASMGIYDASLGQPGPEQSGKAILARQKQGDKATLNFSDNLRRTVRQVGRILMEWIPVIYDAPRIQRIISGDNSSKNVGIYNSKTMPEDYSPEEALQELQELEPHIQEVYDIGVGRYSVVVSAGANAQSKRQEAVSSIMALVQAYPNLMQVAGDLLVANMDWPYADLISKRLKKQLPPNLLESDGSPEAQLQQAQQQLQQLGQQHDLLTKALTEATELIKSKTMELESKERIALINNQTQLAVAQVSAEGAAGLQTLKAMQGAIQSRLELIHEHMTIAQEAQADMQVASHEASLQPPEDNAGQGGGGGV